MPAIHNGSPKLKFSFVPSRKQSVLGGLPAIEALAQQFGLWEKLRALRWLDPRKRTGSGFGPDAIVAQLVYSFVVGGASLADAERVGEDRLARRLSGMARFADESTLGEWLRAQSPESVHALWDLIRTFVVWGKERALGARWRYDGRAENFFDDTQVEVSGKEFEGAKWNYAGDLALSWQTLWHGPWLVDGDLGSPGDVSGALPEMLERNQELWAGQASDFLADSGSSAAKYLAAIAGAGFTQWSVSYNKWTSVLERTAAAQPESAWGPVVERVWREGPKLTEQHCRVRHTPAGREATYEFATVRYRAPGELFWRHAFVGCEGGRDAAAVWARHRLKGEKELLFKEVLRGLDLHHPPCAELLANGMFYAIAALAYDLMVVVKILCLPDECQGWQVRTLMARLVRLPATLVAHARRLVARVEVPGSWLGWWQAWVERWWPRAGTAPAG